MNSANKSSKHGLLLSLLLHLSLLLFFLSPTFLLTNKLTKKPKPPELYIPSYVYHSTPMQAAPPAPTPKASPVNQQERLPVNLPKTLRLPSSPKKIHPSLSTPSILDMSRAMLQQDQTETAVRHLHRSEPPILMIGDKNAVVDPLAKLMGRALSAHFSYPKMEGSFGLRGKVFVDLVLHPEGYFSDIQIIQSSGNQNFDAAAMYAINSAPTVIGADKFLSTPEHFVVGFIFD